MCVILFTGGIGFPVYTWKGLASQYALGRGLASQHALELGKADSMHPTRMLSDQIPVFHDKQSVRSDKSRSGLPLSAFVGVNYSVNITF